MESISINKHPLQALAINDEAKKASLDQSVRNLLVSEVFWDSLEGFLKLLKPVSDTITEVEGDNKNLSLVPKVFSELQESFKKNVSLSPILKSEETRLMEIIPKRRKFLLRNIHLAANLLDPRYKGCHISGEEAVNVFLS